ncbi:hypothetical protein GCM10022223_43230 [Kineosporia mesophila]|uniref:Uncharacterized protein n=1 Tax=Kineosporia mesophila TaxID=566012 RepID=A0ABP6ZYG7_9ACTN
MSWYLYGAVGPVDDHVRVGDRAVGPGLEHVRFQMGGLPRWDQAVQLIGQAAGQGAVGEARVRGQEEHSVDQF